MLANFPARSKQNPASQPAPTATPGLALPAAPGASETPMPMSAPASAMPAPTKPNQTHKLGGKRDWDAAQAPVRLHYRSLCVYHKPYLNAKAESKMGISIVPLDLRSGDVSDGGPRFIEPASRGEMKAFVQFNEPWEEWSLDPIDEEHEDHPKNIEGQSWADDAKFEQGTSMLTSLQGFGQTPFVDGDFEWFNPDWEAACDLWHLQAMDSKDFRLWWLEGILVSGKTHRPHAHAFLNHVIPLREDKLTTGELALATGIISSRRCFQGFNDHRYIHATIFSASFRNLRVIQVWHDREDPSALHVRRSPIMDFMQGEKAKWVDWITLLCWMMGDQLDDPTMSSQTSKMAKSQPKEAASRRTDIDQLDSNHSESSHSDTSRSDSTHSDSNESDGAGAEEGGRGWPKAL